MDVAGKNDVLDLFNLLQRVVIPIKMGGGIVISLAGPGIALGRARSGQPARQQKNQNRIELQGRRLIITANAKIGISIFNSGPISNFAKNRNIFEHGGQTVPRINLTFNARFLIGAIV